MTSSCCKPATSRRLAGLILLSWLLLSGLPSLWAEARSTYVLGANDEVTIRALHAPEISDKAYRVEQSGFINLPMLGRVRATDLTVEELETVVAKRMEEFYNAPKVSIAITEYRSQPVSVIGAVGLPGVHQLKGQKTVLEVLSLAGGARADAGPLVKITRKMIWGKIPLGNAKEDETGQFSVAALKLKDLMEAKSPSDNIGVRPDDVISIPKADLIYVVGEVKKPGGFVLGTYPNMSVLEALSLAEGLGLRAAPGKAKILRSRHGQEAQRVEVPVDLSKLLAGKARDISLYPDDILFVPNSAAKSAALRSIEAAVQIGTGLVIWRR